LTVKRPVYLNLIKIRLPVTGMVSIAHRVSGFLLFLSIPFSIYLLDLSVTSSQGYEQSVQLLQHPVIQILLLFLVWALLHHLLAGVRYLLLDFDIAIDKAASKMTAWTVIAAEVCIMAVYVWGVIL
jgi:succinate dehydrogenase / fumarate reductase cytochrome b subunit